MMHYDKKISCALGILLVGIVTALFFRHEKSEATEVPALENPASLDAKIARKSVRPYEAPSRLAGVIEEAPEATDPRAAKRPYEELPESNAPTAPSGTPPKPISPDRDLASGIAGTGRNSEWTAIARNAHKPASKRDETQRAYLVRPGDTLSGIAYRFLGSSARFDEIFQANRVLLRSPDDLRPGMTLRIPPRRRGTSAVVVKSSQPRPPATKSKASDRKTLTSTPPATSGKSETKAAKQEKAAPSESANGTTKRSGTRRFIPIRSSPFRRQAVPLRSSSATGEKAKPAPAGNLRKLSQKPPKSVPTVDANVWKNLDSKPGTVAAASTGDRPNEKPIEYTVQPGDSLERIAVKFYGRRSAVGRILKTNRSRIRNPNVLRPGTRLLLPRP